MALRLQVSSSGFLEFEVPYSGAIILRRKNTCSVFIPFMECPLIFKHFQKKEDSHSQCISELTIL